MPGLGFSGVTEILECRPAVLEHWSVPDPRTGISGDQREDGVRHGCRQPLQSSALRDVGSGMCRTMPE
jgi:hypothetical protein